MHSVKKTNIHGSFKNYSKDRNFNGLLDDRILRDEGTLE